MRIILALLLLVPGSATTLPPASPDAPERELTRALDQFYTWGDVVLGFKCRVHGRWLDHSGQDAKQGQFWGNLEYRKGAFTFHPERSLGRERDPDRIRDDLTTLIEQAGLLPTGFPLPGGKVTKQPIAGAPKVTDFVVQPARDLAAAPIRFRIERGRVTGVTVPDDGGRGAVRFRIQSTWIPGDRYLLTGLTGDRGKKKDLPRVHYHYHCYTGNYFPRAVTEERGTTRLSFIFYWYDIDLAP